MTIYLYKKTHNQTGLNYLGKTTVNDPHKYQGSRVWWSNHIKAHGYDVTTEILKECQTNEEVREWGSYYSNLWNVVESDEWANLKPEYGEGDDSVTAKKKALKRVAEGTHNFQGESNPSKRLVKEGKHNFQGERNPNHNRLKEGTHNLVGKNNPVHALYANNAHYVQTTEFKEATAKRQQLLVSKGTHPLQGTNSRKIITCPHCGKTGLQGPIDRWHFDNCKHK